EVYTFGRLTHRLVVATFGRFCSLGEASWRCRKPKRNLAWSRWSVAAVGAATNGCHATQPRSRVSVPSASRRTGTGRSCTSESRRDRNQKNHPMGERLVLTLEGSGVGLGVWREATCRNDFMDVQFVNPDLERLEGDAGFDGGYP